MGWPRQAKRIALTFDDGPADTTLDILAVLEAKEVPATFFMVGKRAQRRREIVRRVAASPLAEIGNHTATHADLITRTPGEVRHEVASTTDLLRRLTGTVPTTFRPPRGHHDETVRAIAAECGLSVLLWTINPRDWDHQDPAKTARRVVAQARTGDVIVLHDTLPSTAEAIGPVIDGLRAAGFTFVSPRELTGDVAPGQVADGGVGALTRAMRQLGRLPLRARGLARRSVRPQVRAD